MPPAARNRLSAPRDKVEYAAEAGARSAQALPHHYCVKFHSNLPTWAAPFHLLTDLLPTHRWEL